MIDLVFIIKVALGSFIFLAFISLWVHNYIKSHGTDWGELILNILLTGFIIAVLGGLIIGIWVYALLASSTG